MALEVSRQIKSDAKSGLITRDFLGGGFGIESKELDLDLHVPTGWEKRLDLKSGKVYIQKSKTANSASEQKNSANQISSKPNDSNTIQQSSPSSNSKPTLGLLEQPSLDLKLVPNNNNNNSSSFYTSVCTLDKVKSALDRAERASPVSSSSSSSKRRWMMTVRSQSPSNSSSLSVGEDDRESSRFSTSVASNHNEGLLVAGACPSCLLYVLISKNDPKCPKCNSVVHSPSPMMSKKPKIDLNISI